jgi:hypothetical protein
METSDNLYEILGIPKTSTAEEIKKVITAEINQMQTLT